MVKHYNLFLYIRFDKLMNVLENSAIISQAALKYHLFPYGYSPIPSTPGIWRYTDKKITFALVLDNFFIKYILRTYSDHLNNVIQHRY